MIWITILSSYMHVLLDIVDFCRIRIQYDVRNRRIQCSVMAALLCTVQKWVWWLKLIEIRYICFQFICNESFCCPYSNTDACWLKWFILHYNCFWSVTHDFLSFGFFVTIFTRFFIDMAYCHSFIKFLWMTCQTYVVDWRWVFENTNQMSDHILYHKRYLILVELDQETI